MEVLSFLAEHALTLLTGSTILLGAGVLAVASSRAPIHRQRCAELAIGGAVLWLVLALVPMPRWLEPWPTAAAGPEVPSIAVLAEAADLGGHVPVEYAAGVDFAEPPIPARAPAATSPLVRPSPPSEDGAATAAWPWARLVVAVYLAGVAVWSAYLLLGCLLLRRVIVSAKGPESWLRRLVDSEANAAGLARRPRVCVTQRPCSPFCFGVRRPTIVLPAALCMPELEVSLRHVVAHEIAHLRQRDGRGHALLAMALPLLYLHPLFWWLRAQAHLAAELVADDLAAGQTDARSYAHALIDVSQSRALRPVLPGAASVRRSPSEFYRRMNMLLQRESRLSTECSPLRRRAQLLIVGAIVAVTASAFGVPEVRAQDPGVSWNERKLRTERDRLQTEVQSLRAELRQIRRRLAPLGISDEPELEPGMEPEEIVDLIEVVDPEEPEEIVAETFVLEPVAEVVTESRVPILADIPMIGERFERRDARAQPRPAEADTTSDSRYVVDLVTRAIDLHGELEIARHRLELLGPEYRTGAAAAEEAKIMAIQLETISRKYRAMQQMIEAEQQATSMELKSLRAIAEGLRKAESPDRALESRALRLEARLRMLGSAQ